MDTRTGEGNRERSRRPVRNKRYSRRTYGEDKRPPKRLFTPEIKRFLKDWLVRRRENPYPNREEKKMLAVQTGLTYIQVCNWFANWRRKLKNAGKEPQQKTWGDLIKTYNNQVQGNVEHFSICSDDSIWEEPDTYSNFDDEINDRISIDKKKSTSASADHSYTYPDKKCFNNNNSDVQNQCYYVSSTTETDPEANPFAQTANKYKNHIMEKYLRDCQKPEYRVDETGDANKPSMISKWLESAANFKPSENNYIDWTFSRSSKKKCKKTVDTANSMLLIHGREELDAAEALTTLANSRNYKQL
ncbi:iroquois-class homeodomain protein irx-3 isoform X2 [Anoplophora glabripennis]|uniref:iroquois-class homeodomain protein irx-3 isoform X2 n=1 Tax=Anoplophora glabripennis TaxID=217634 RepID=UPI000873F8EB|nr:iroquois-class homeodomain protein irx-3 isoform X2 [Anoplophora glabripennis]